MAQFEREMQKNRGVAQLVARYVRDVEVGCSSHLTPTKKDETNVSSFFVSPSLRSWEVGRAKRAEGVSKCSFPTASSIKAKKPILMKIRVGRVGTLLEATSTDGLAPSFSHARHQ